MFAFDSVPEEYLTRLRASEQLHLFRLPDQINYFFLVLQKTNLLRQLLTLALTYLKYEDLSTFVAGRKQIVFDGIKQETFDFALHWWTE